jgi:succinate-semialdehyde dehydrogenase/glutarate-semialdehyde dehydrogenase
MTALLPDHPPLAADAPADEPPLLDPARAARLASRLTTSPRAAQREVRSPVSGRLVGMLPLSDEDDVESAYRAARAAQRAWAERGLAARARVLMRVHDLVLERRDEILDICLFETGKARRHGLEELLDVALNARYYARNGKRLLKTRRRKGIAPILNPVWEVRHPKGVVGVIAPWNYPITVGLSDSLPALLAGNAVVIKPDWQTTFTALALAEVLADAGVPEQVYQVVVGDGPVVGPMVVDRADYVCFTGSTRVGREVAQRAGARLKGCSLELGGKNAGYVRADAHLDRTVEAMVRACFSNSGQLCISIERLYVHDALYDDFTARFAQAVDGLRVGSGHGYDVEMGSMISAAQLARTEAHVDEAVAQGARVLAGGVARPDLGPFFYAPTILEGVRPGMAVYADETFGPVVSVYRVADDEEAVRLANDSPYGLNAAIFSRDVRTSRRLARRINAGTVNINEGYGSTWGATDSPMGGMGDSGLGRRHGAEGMLKYTEAQTIAAQRLVGFGYPPQLPPERTAALLAALPKALKWMGRR